MPITNLSNPSSDFIVPGTYQDYTKIVITADSGTDYTVLDSYGGAIADNYIVSAKISREATGKLASFTVELSNNDGIFLNLFDGGETIIFYADSTDATTEIFRAKIDDVKYAYRNGSGFTVNIDGRQYPELADKTITGVEGASTIGAALCGIFYNFYDDITLKYWNGTAWVTATYDNGLDEVTWSDTATGLPTDTINLTYEHRKGWNVMTDICKIVELDCFLEYDSGWVIKIFNREAITNGNCSIGYGVNLLSMSDYGTENSEVFNRVYVYGATIGDNVIRFKSKSDTASQTNLWIKDKIINDDSVDTMDELDSMADYQLSLNSSAISSGRFSALGLKTINPGEKITISVPFCNVNGSFVAKKITHDFMSYIKTTIEVTKASTALIDLFIPQINYDGFLSGFNNPNSMLGSYSSNFEDRYNYNDSVTLSNVTRASDGSIKLWDGLTTGTITFDTYTTAANVTQCEVRKYDNYDTTQDVYEVSNDGGSTYEVYKMGVETIHNFATVGTSLKLKVTLNRTVDTDPSPAYKALAILYK